MKTIHMQPYRRAIEDLRSARLLLNMSQLEAGRRLGVTRHWVAKAESCEVRLDIIQFIRVCRVYRVDAGRLLGRLEEELSDEDGPSFTYRTLPCQRGRPLLPPQRRATVSRFSLSRSMYAWISDNENLDDRPTFRTAGASPRSARRYSPLTEIPRIWAASLTVTSRSFASLACASSFSCVIMPPFWCVRLAAESSA